MRWTLIALAICGITVPSFGQGPSGGKSVDVTRRELQEKRKTIVEQAIYLTEQEKQPFWTLYQDWRAKSAGIGDRRFALVAKIEDSGNLTDAEAKSLLDEWLQIEKDRVKMREDYVKRFRKILPDKKVARFFQLENKMDAIVDYDLAGKVALIE